MWMKYLRFLINIKPFRRLGSLVLLFTLLCIPGHLAAQPFMPVEEFPRVQGFFASDALNNIYSIENGVLIKTNPQGQVKTYSNRQFGNVSSVDATDPFNLVVFFKAFGNIVLLDNNLSEKNTFQARKLHLSDIPSLVCFSSKNGFWAFFPNSFQLIRFNLRGEPQNTGIDLSLAHPGMGDGVFMTESDNKLFLAANGIWVFDLYANFLFHISHIQTRHFQVKGNKVFYVNGDRLISYDFFLKQENVFLLPESRVKSFFVKNNQTIFLQTDVSLKKFTVAEKLY